MSSTVQHESPVINASRQPAGLRVLFFTEMWERFSYYGMRALLVIYLVNALGYSNQDALALYGIYTGLVYLMPLLGGALADQYLGQRRAVIVGGVLMMLGHLAMAFDALLYVALGLLIIGNGFFKPNVSSMVGALYEDRNDPRSAGGYSIFYMGVNLGAFLAPFVAGSVGERVGWHYGFAVAAVGMAIGLWQLFRGQALLGQAGLLKHQTEVGRADIRLLGVWVLASVGLVVLSIVLWSWVGEWFTSWPLWVRMGFILVLMVGSLWGVLKPKDAANVQPLTRPEWLQIMGLILTMSFVIIFWTAFEQSGGSMSLFIDQKTDRQLGSFLIPTSWFQSINPLGIVVMAPLFSVFWTRLNRSRFAVSDVVKIGAGMMVLGLGCVLMIQVEAWGQASASVQPWWLVAVLMLFTIGELMLSPVGLSLVSKVAPMRLVSLLMGLWLLNSAIANYLAGTLEHRLQGTGWPLYTFLSVVTLGCGALLIVLSPLLNRMMKLKQA